jgi:allantoicase
VFKWTQTLTRVRLGPNSRHIFSIASSPTVNYVKLNIYPDGGIVRTRLPTGPVRFLISLTCLAPQARFRVYGVVTPAFPQDLWEELDLAHVFSGGRVVFTSDQHFGVGSSLIIPGRGEQITPSPPPFLHLPYGTHREGHGRWLGNQAQPRTRSQRLGHHQTVSQFPSGNN